MAENPYPETIPGMPVGDDIFKGVDLSSLMPHKPLQDSYDLASKENPDQSAKIVDFSKKLNQPEIFIANNLKEAERVMTKPDFEKIYNDYPQLSKFLVDPKNMAMAHDDIDNLSNIEHTHSAFKNKFKAMGGAIGGLVQYGGGALEQIGAIDKWGGLEKIGGIESKVGQSISDYGKKMVEYYAIDNPSFLDKFTAAATSGAAFFVPSAGIARGAAMLLSMPRLAAFVGGSFSAAFESAIESGGVWESMKAKGKTDSEALTAANKTFAANMVLNTGLNYAGGLFGKILPKGKSVLSQGSAIKQVAKGIAKSGTAEGIQEGSQQVISNVYGEEQDRMSGVWESAILGAIVGSGMSGTIDIYNKVGEHGRAELSKEYIEKSAETYAAAKLPVRANDTANTLVDAQAVPVHISPKVFDTYFQSQGIDPIQAATELNALESYTEAKKLGIGKMEIKQSAFVGKDMATHRPALMDDVTVDPEGKSINELKEEQVEIQAKVKEYTTEAETAIKANPELQTAHDFMVKDFIEDVGPAMVGVKGKGAKSSVQHAAEVNAAFTITESGKRGLDPVAFYNERKASFFGPKQGAVSGGGLFQSAWHGSPHDFDKFSLHAIGTGEGAQAYGYGLYFAGDKAVADYYKQTLSKTDIYVDGVKVEGGLSNSKYWAAKMVVHGGVDAAKVQAEHNGAPKSAIDDLEALRGKKVEEKSSGKLYEVEIPDSDKMLDWDKPLKEQDPEVKKALMQVHGISDMVADVKGSIIHGYLTDMADGMKGPFKKDFVRGDSSQRVSEYLNSLGIHGIKYLDGNTRNKSNFVILEEKGPQDGKTYYRAKASNNEKVFNTREEAQSYIDKNQVEQKHNYVIFDDNAVSIIKKHYQGGNDPLASYTKTEQGAVIKLFKGANASSLLHELSHKWLEDIHDYVKSGNANAEYMADFAITQDYLGHKTGEAITTEQHEKWAQSFEKYIMDGKAPSVELMTAFEKLKSWMMKVYDGVKSTLGIEISPAIRGVFDRMLATKEAIEQARVEIGLAEESAPGLTGEALKARQMAEAMLLKPLMDEMSLSNQDKLAKLRITDETESKEAIKLSPVYASIQDIISYYHPTGEIVTEKMIRKEADKYILGELPEAKTDIFQAVAESNGFSSGDELLKKIASSEHSDIVISNMVAEKMKPFERLNDKEALKDDALKALHTGDNMGQLLALEGQVLEGMRLNKEVNAELSATRRANASREWEAVKTLAAETLGNKNVKEAGKFRTYYTLERKAAERYTKAMAKGDTEAAIKTKHEQLVAHALAAESVRISDNTDKVLRQVHKIVLKKKELFKEEKNFNQVADLLAKYGFYNRRDYNPELKYETLKGWAERVGATLSLLNEDGSVVDGSSLVSIPDWILTDSKVTDYGKLTVNEFLDLTDTIKHIVHLGNIQDNAFKVGDGKAIKLIVEDLIAQGQRSMPADRPREVEPGRFDMASRWANDYMGGIKRMDTMVWELDGKKDTGPWRDYFIKSQYKQANYESDKRFEYKKGMEELWKIYDKKEFKAMFEKQEFYTEIGKSMTRQRLIAMALNIGAKENRAKLFNNIPYGMEGAINWNEQSVMAMLEKYLTKKDWEFVQGTWDLIGKLWPDTVALHEEMTGFKPGKVESVAFEVVADGEIIKLPGGYFPLRADPRDSALAAQREVSTAPIYTELNPAWKQGVKHRHTEKRTNVQYSVALDLTTIDRHISEVTHDLAFRALCHDFNRILSNRDMQAFLRNKMGDSGLNFFRNYTASIAAGGNAEQLSQDGISSMVRDLNSRISTAVILGRISVLTQNLANPFLAINAVEGFTAYDIAKGMLSKGMGNYWVKATTNWEAMKEMQEQVFALSPFMRDKHTRPDYSLSDMKDNQLNNFMGGLIAGSDNLTNIPLWLEAYEKKMGETNNSDKAVEYADLLINRISGSGRKYDQAKMTRGSDLERLITKFYSFWNIEYQNWIRNVKTEIANPIANTPAFLGFVASRAMFSYLSAILVGKGPFGDDDDENKKFWIGPLRDPVQFFPGARDLINVAIDQSLGLKSYGYRPAPIVGAFENLTRLGPKIQKGEPEAIAEGITKIMSVGIPLGITPAYPDQFNVWFWNAYDYLINDMEPQLSDITKRRPVRER